MSYLKRTIVSIILVLTISYVLTNSSPVQAATDTMNIENFIVKVKLINNLGPSKTYQFTPKGDTILKEDDTIILKKDMTYKIVIQNSKITLFEGETLLKENLTTVTLEPLIYNNVNFILLQNSTSTAKQAHIGTIIFNLITKSNTLYLQPVNHLGFEDYLKGVLPGEMPASWGATGGQEALRAQAVAARSYVFSKLIGNSTKEIDDTVTYQVYKGFVWDPISPTYGYFNQYTNLAVDSTKGMIMTYKKADGTTGFVTGFFSASNGGQTELPQQYWSNGLPYINKSQPDTFDSYKWPSLLQFEKKQLNIASAMDFTNPDSWWNTITENNLAHSNIKSQTSFTKIKAQTLKELKASDPTIESIKIDSVNNIVTKEYVNTGKVENITFNLSYYIRKTNPDNSLYYSMKLGAQSVTLAGPTRYETAVEVAREGWTGKRNVAVLGRGDLPVDALAGSVLAYKLDTPILLTKPNELPTSVKDYWKESLNPGAIIYLLGGNVAISPSVEAEILKLGYKPTRVSGATRTETSLAIAKLVGGSSTSVFFATGDEKSSDALSISPYAARNQTPIIIQYGDKVSTATTNYLKTSSKKSINIIGGEVAVSSNVVKTLNSAGFATSRTSGSDRVDTSIAINKKFQMPGDSLAIGNAYQFIDSLAGSVIAAKDNSSILLLNPDPKQIPIQYIDLVNQPKTLYYLGGESIVSKDLKYNLSTYIGGTLQKHTSEVKLTGAQLRSLLGGTTLMSTDFKVTNDTVNNEFVLNGTGFGHGIGMSQHGAYARSKAGHTLSDILWFYYQGIKIEQAKDYIN